MAKEFRIAVEFYPTNPECPIGYGIQDETGKMVAWITGDQMEVAYRCFHEMKEVHDQHMKKMRGE